MPVDLALTLFQSAGQGDGGGLFGFLPLILIIGVFYFVLIRPQNKARQQAEQETRDMLSSLKNGDKVVTSGGILGTIRSVKDDTVSLQIADAVKIEVLRTAITGKQSGEKPAADAKP
jgi:preprotein translocase subunit YajC